MVTNLIRKAIKLPNILRATLCEGTPEMKISKKYVCSVSRSIYVRKLNSQTIYRRESQCNIYLFVC